MSPELFRTTFGPVALVTGASDGIGRAFASSLAARGLNLVLVARRATVLEDLARDLSHRHGVKVRTVPLDLAEPTAAARLLAEVEADDLGLLVAAAGYGSSGSFLAQDAGEEARMVDVNCRAVVELAHGLSTRFSHRNRGGLVLFGSLVGFQGVPWSATYAATKAFVQSLAEGLAVELAPRGVPVLSVAPGPVASGFGARARMNMGQAAQPEAIAEGALRALGSRRVTVRPGLLSKGLGWFLGLLPRAARVRVMGRIMHSMAEVGR
jgi:hypothetical protein